MSDVLAGLMGIASVPLGFALAGGFRRTPPIYFPPVANTTPPTVTELTGPPGEAT